MSGPVLVAGRFKGEEQIVSVLKRSTVLMNCSHTVVTDDWIFYLSYQLIFTISVSLSTNALFFSPNWVILDIPGEPTIQFLLMVVSFLTISQGFKVPHPSIQIFTSSYLLFLLNVLQVTLWFFIPISTTQDESSLFLNLYYFCHHWSHLCDNPPQDIFYTIIEMMFWAIFSSYYSRKQNKTHTHHSYTKC